VIDVGRRTLSNLALLCRRHHRAVHEEGYQLDRQPECLLIMIGQPGRDHRRYLQEQGDPGRRPGRARRA